MDGRIYPNGGNMPRLSWNDRIEPELYIPDENDGDYSGSESLLNTKVEILHHFLYEILERRDIENLKISIIEMNRLSNINESLNWGGFYRELVGSGWLEGLKLLIKSGLKVETLSDSGYLDHVSYGCYKIGDYKENCESKACNSVILEEKISILNYLINIGIDINEIFDSAFGSLVSVTHVLSAYPEDLPLLEIVLNNKSDLEITCRDGFTPICWAFFHKNKEALKLYLERGADISLKEGDEELLLHSGIEGLEMSDEEFDTMRDYVKILKESVTDLKPANKK